MEWTVITVLVALVGLLATVGAPVIKLNSNLTKLTVLLDTLKNDMQEQKKSAKESHRRLWGHNHEQDGRIENHEKRITLLEQK